MAPRGGSSGSLQPDRRCLLLSDDRDQPFFIPVVEHSVLTADLVSHEVAPRGCVVAVDTAEPEVGTTLIRLPR
jgi:hypothetical protein